MVETINHLTYVQMLSDQTPASKRVYFRQIAACMSIAIEDMIPLSAPPPPLIPPVRIRQGLPPQRLNLNVMQPNPMR